MTLPSRRAPREQPDAPPAGAGGLDDRALVAAVCEGDGTALEVLYRRYGRACYGLLRPGSADPR